MGANCSAFNHCCNIDKEKGNIDLAELALLDDVQAQPASPNQLEDTSKVSKNDGTGGT